MLGVSYFKRLKATILIVGGLVVSFGMYAAFHALDAYGHGGADLQKTVTTDMIRLSSSDTSKMLRRPVKSCNYYRKYTTRKTIAEKTRIITHYHMSNGKWNEQSRSTNSSSSSSSTTFWALCGNSNCAG